jgi:hypothetical protein
MGLPMQRANRGKPCCRFVFMWHAVDRGGVWRELS